MQAKIYLNLAKLGKADIKTIAAASNIARQDIYRAISTLQELGLTEKILAKNAVYRATSIKEGLAILLEKQKRECTQIEEQAEACFCNFHERNKTASLAENVEFSITAELVHLLKSHEKMAESTKSSLKMIIPLKLDEWQFLIKFGYVKRAMRRGVKVRVILQETMRKPIKTPVQDRLFELRYLPESAVPSGMHIFDDRELTLAVSRKNPTPSLWTNSPHLVELAEVYFESMWNNAK